MAGFVYAPSCSQVAPNESENHASQGLQGRATMFYSRIYLDADSMKIESLNPTGTCEVNTCVIDVEYATIKRVTIQ